MTAGDTAILRYQFDFSLVLRVQMPDSPRSRLEGNLPTGSPPLPRALPGYQVQPSGLSPLDLPHPAPPLSHWRKTQ